MSSTSPRRQLNRSKPASLALEARIMFDAALAVSVEHVAHEAPPPADAPHADAADASLLDAVMPAAVGEAAAAARTVLFIDKAVPDWEKLAAAAAPGVEVVLLEQNRDGFEQMLAALQGYAPLDSIQIISHGGSGKLSLAATTLTNDNIANFGAELAQLGGALTANGDILIFGCDVAEGEGGQRFIEALAAGTGADVAASTDTTGAAALGANWVLERQTGAIEAGIALADTASYDGTLAVLAAPSTTWHDVMVGANFDPSNDQQANAGQDVVGDATHAMLQATQTADAVNPVFYFRARYGDVNLSGTSFYLALDISGDKVADIFIEAKVAANGTTSMAFHTRDSSKAGTGPSNTGWQNSTNNTAIQLDLTTAESYVAASQILGAGNDLDASGTGDSWLTFGFTLNALKSFAPAAAVTKSTSMVMYAFTSTAQTANGDIAGVADGSIAVGATWASLGLGTVTTLDAVTTTDFGTPTMSVSNVTVSEASPYAVFNVSLDKPAPAAVSFTPTLASGTATVGADTGSSSALEYYNGSSWVSASGGVTIASGATSVLVRTAITNDTSYEGPESFTLSTGAVTGSVANASGATGTGTIKDDGSSTNVFLVGNTTGTPTVGAADNDQGADLTKPTVVSIDRQSPANILTNADSLTFRVTFSEAVANVSAADFTVGGTTGGVTGVTSAGGNAYDVTISGGDLAGYNGNVTLAFAGGQDIADIAGNTLTAVTPSGTDNHTYTLDNAGPSAATGTLTIAENSSNGSAVGTVAATDSSGPVTYTLNANAGGRFAVSSAGALTVADGTQLNYEANTSHSITVRATDSLGNFTDTVMSVAVTNVNEAPALSTVTNLTGATEDTPYTISYASLLAAGNQTDVDAGTTFSFRIEAVSSGTLTKNGAAVVAGGTLVSAGESLVWTPASNVNGSSVAAFTVKAYDGALASPTAVAVNVNVAAVDDAPAFANLGGTVNYAHGSAAVFLDTDATIGDIELAAASYNGASLTLVRNGGASANDTFSSALFSGSNVVVGAATVGTLTNSGGTLAITFNANATEAIAGQVLQSIKYTNSVDIGDFQLDYAFSDGSTIAQGSGGPLTATGSVALSLAASDLIAPTVVSIDRQSPSSILTNADSLTFRVTFSEAVANVSAADFTVGGTTGGVTGVASAGGNAYDVTISGGDLAGYNGNVTLAFAGGQDIADTAGNALTAPTPSGTDNHTYMLDNAGPSAATGALTIAENSSNGSAVGTVTATDISGPVTYTLTASAGGRLAVSSAGALTVADGTLLNYEANTSHSITVRAT
ncbi:MAG: DUF4347 domain-containing protein, partial [Massilia sp.]